jgi:hypothetical protein
LQEEYSLRGKTGADAFSASLKSLELKANPNGGGQAIIAQRRSNLRQEPMEEQVDQLMERLVIPAEWYDMILAYCLTPKGISDYRLRRFNLIKELSQVRDMYRLRALTQAEYERWVLEINRQLNQLQPSVQPEVQENLALLRDFKSLWRQMDGSHKKMILQAMFDGLYFDHEHRLCKVAAHSPFDRLLGME